MRERSWNNVVRRAGALALVWVLVAVASWAIASGGGGKKSGHSQPQPVVTGSQASLQLPALNAKLPAMRVKRRRQSAHAGQRRSSRSSGRTTHVDAPVSETTTTVVSPAISATSSAGSSSAGSSSSGSSNVPPTGGAPAP